MENQNDLLQTGIGTKEGTILKPALVTIKEIEIKTKTKKETGEQFDMIVCSCTHPEKKEGELVKLDKAIFLKNQKVKKGTLWISKDEDNLIIKNSTLAFLMRHLNIDKPVELKDKTIMTILDDDNYLCFKAY